MNYKKYLEIKNETPKQIVAVRLCDFYEIMGNDAIIVSKMLDITLAKKEEKDGSKVLYCGFPYCKAEQYQADLLSNTGILMHLIDTDINGNVIKCR